MRFTLTLESSEPEFFVPLHYNASIQAALYNLLPEDFSAFLHDTGFVYEKRTFRLFTFSRLLGEYTLKRREGRMYFLSPVRLIVSSPLLPFCEAILESLLKEERLRIGSALLRVTGVDSQQNLVLSEAKFFVG